MLMGGGGAIMLSSLSEDSTRRGGGGRSGGGNDVAEEAPGRGEKLPGARAADLGGGCISKGMVDQELGEKNDERNWSQRLNCDLT
jgi:hypothetical protein